MSFNKIVFCTLRDNRGATGGPGGVLFLQKELIGNHLLHYQCEYWFNRFTKKSKFRNKLNEVNLIIKAIFTRKAYFIAHDVKSAYILARLGKSYSVIFHHQGPLVEEYANLGVKINDRISGSLKLWEKEGFVNALSVHFPSRGAADMYFQSDKASVERSFVNVGEPLFNVILPSKITKPIDFQLEKEKDVLTFFSLGTLTIAKGQDQTAQFLSTFLKHYNGNVRYIIVGKGPLKNQLISSLDKICSHYSNFKYHYIESVPHPTVMYIHQIADVYIMMHRISIFDFATLEAMSQGSAIVLSKVGGNTDFNKEQNVIFAEDAINNMAAFAKTNFEQLKLKNKEVFETYFSKEAYCRQYVKFVERYVNCK